MAQISYDTLTITNIPDNLRQNFWVETTSYSSQIPAGVYITQNSASSFKNNPSGPNIFMQATNDNNGIRLRQGLLTLAEIMSDRFRLYTPNGSTQGLLGLSLNATDGLVLYRTNNNALMAEVTENTIPSQPEIDTEVFLSQISTVGNHQFIYHVSGENYYWTYNESEVELTDYGITFSAIEDAPFWADGEYLTIRVFTSVIAEKGVQLSSAGLGLFGSSQNTADVTVDSGGINIGKGKIIGGEVGSSYVPKDDFLYLSTQNYGSYLNVADSGFRKNWRLVIGKYFGVTEGGNAYLNGATISGKIIAMTGQIGGTSVGDSWGWTLKLGQLYSGTMGSDNSLHMRTLNLGTNDEAVSINNCAPRKDWRLTVGSKFGVTSTGELFADGANLTNINAGSINIGPVVKYYVCDTTAATSAKIIDNVSNFTLITGLTINVTFTYGNTSSVPTLNINDTGAISIKSYDGSDFSNSYEYNIAAGSSRTFTYNGTYWLLQDNGAGDAYLRAYNAEDTAYNYITYVNSTDGIKVHSLEDSSSYVQLNANYLRFYRRNPSATTDSSKEKLMVDINSGGIYFYDGTRKEPSNADIIASFKPSALTFYTNWKKTVELRSHTNSSTLDGGLYIYSLDNTSVSLGKFTGLGVTIGKNNDQHILIDSNGMHVYSGTESNSTKLASFGSTIVLGSSATANAVRTEINGGSMVLKKRTSSNDGEYTIASFGESISLSNSLGSIEITSTGINFNTSGTAKGVLKFNSYPILSVQHLKYTKTTTIAAGATWEINQALPASVLNNYTVLGIVGYNFDNGTSVGMSYMNVYECSISSDGTKLYFKARNLSSYQRAKGMIIHIYLLVMPKNSQYSNPNAIEYDDSSSSIDPDA